MERDNRDEDMMLKGTKQEMPGFYFRLLRSEEKRELWNPDFELLFLLRGTGRVSYEDGEVHSLPVGSVFAINRFQICDLDLDEDGLALSLCISAETIASFHIKLLKKVNPFVESNIFRSVENVNIDTVVGYKQHGIRHNFLEGYDDNPGYVPEAEKAAAETE